MMGRESCMTRIPLISASLILGVKLEAKAAPDAILVFLIDGSDSVDPSELFRLELEGIAGCFDPTASGAFIPLDGSCAISVVQFDHRVRVELPPTLLAGTTQEITSIANTIRSIVQLEVNTDLSLGLEEAIEQFRVAQGTWMGTAPLQQILVVATDLDACDTAPIALAQEIRTGTGQATGLPPTRICTVQLETNYSTVACVEPTSATANPLLHLLANTPHSSQFLDTFDCRGDMPQACTWPAQFLSGPAYPGEPVGAFSCIPSSADIGKFALLCTQCACGLLNATGNDCDSDGEPDICESRAYGATDCDQNEVLDVCEYEARGFCSQGFPAGCTPSDCNENSIPDLCEVEDCDGSAWCDDRNGNGLMDSCDILDCDGAAWCQDCDGNGVLDEYEWEDCDGDGVLDGCEIWEDCDGNGVRDACELAAGTALDANANLILDDCEVRLYVDLSTPVPDVQQTGAGWATAYDSLQEALAEAVLNPEVGIIAVADGYYYPDTPPKTAGDRTASFDLPSGLTIVGGFRGFDAQLDSEDWDDRDPALFRTVLSGDIGTNGVKTDNSYHVVKATDTTECAGLHSVVITGGLR